MLAFSALAKVSLPIFSFLQKKQKREPFEFIRYELKTVPSKAGGIEEFG